MLQHGVCCAREEPRLTLSLSLSPPSFFPATSPSNTGEHAHCTRLPADTRVYLLAALTLDGAEARAEGGRGARAQVGRVAPLLQARGRLHRDLVDEICGHEHTHSRC